ncbi:tetratricopeptide repeat protein [Algoriphagus sediminis]|uniref:Tetratricopeptide repeat protein n=1 Tax=Algoriphagus sediminis TaxID=3057113 RepID=A0ABT7YGC5_9BACT|nr:tetratricopeptide repeat protein [Algoriphagus sediminis]MDN3205570.1 hypothetical protein [Algoriphagus sediminis]
MTRIIGVLFISSLLFACGQSQKLEETSDLTISAKASYTTPLGKTFELSEPSAKLLEQYEEAKSNYESDPQNVENLIWYGRRAAYLGRYEEAINIYSDGITKFPKEPKLYRHRGHRFISLREYDKAIADLEKAAQLIQGTENEVEPDGMPNALNIPVSTLHGNIYYHLGLAYYLTHDYEKAYEAYLKCRESGSRYDNIVSSTHWLFMIQQRLHNPSKADSLLAPIHSDSTVIENQSYADLCELYKGWILVDSLLQEGPDDPSNHAVRYGVANWFLYNGDTSRARDLMWKMIDASSFTSFGYLAAESDLIEYFEAKK